MWILKKVITRTRLGSCCKKCYILQNPGQALALSLSSITLSSLWQFHKTFHNCSINSLIGIWNRQYFSLLSICSSPRQAKEEVVKEIRHWNALKFGLTRVACRWNKCLSVVISSANSPYSSAYSLTSSAPWLIRVQVFVWRQAACRTSLFPLGYSLLG